MLLLRMIPAVLLIVLTAGPATAGVGQDIFVYPDRGGDTPVSLCCFPNGQGKAFSQAYQLGGGEIDATLTIRFQYGEDFVANFPSEDIWLESREGLLAPCNGGTTADQNTDADGYTFWAEPLQAGGQCDAGAGDELLIILNGDVPLDGIIDGFSLNSPDVNGDLAVDLADIGAFSIDYYSGTHNYRCDFQWNGTIDLGDVGILAQASGARCP